MLLFQLHRKIQTEFSSSQSGNPRREDVIGQLELGKYNMGGRALSQLGEGGNSPKRLVRERSLMK